MTITTNRERILAFEGKIDVRATLYVDKFGNFVALPMGHQKPKTINGRPVFAVVTVKKIVEEGEKAHAR